MNTIFQVLFKDSRFDVAIFLLFCCCCCLRYDAVIGQKCNCVTVERNEKKVTISVQKGQTKKLPAIKLK